MPRLPSVSAWLPQIILQGSPKTLQARSEEFNLEKYILILLSNGSILQTSTATNAVAQSMDTAAKAMAAVGKANNPAEMQKIMQQFQRENAKSEMAGEMMDDALDSAFDTDDIEDETDDLVDQVILTWMSILSENCS